MLVTRQYETGRNNWSSSKLEGIYHNTSSSRMSNFESAQPEWREQFPTFPSSGENGSLAPSHAQSASNDSKDKNEHSIARPALQHRHSLEPYQKEPHQALVVERSDSAPAGDATITDEETERDDSLVSPRSTAPSVTSNALSSVSSAPAYSGVPTLNKEIDVDGDVKDEDDDLDEDDDMLDAEEEEGAPAQTAEQRRAERRKMKRFRLTHQQTRFLMSEFAKQAHPDAAHRERLSREIPGLSPRQVQVWFQNRRAKIKRLTVDDRERMMKMRAVPDDFDNVQALHSPYGAVHGMSTPLHSPVDYVPHYSDHLMRPMMVNTMRRNENVDNMSPGISPAYNHPGFASSGSMGTPDILSPVSMNASDRYYTNNMSSPMSSGPRSANPFDRQNSYHSMPPRHHVRPLQPLQLRETMSRSRSDSLNSPLRSSMSWKGETLDYNSYQPGQPSPALSGRQQSVYQPEQLSNSSVNSHQYDANPSSYSSSNMSSSPTHMSYSTNASSLQQSSPSAMSRLRASSGGQFPPGLDLRNQYRSIQSHNNSPHGTTPRSSSFAGAFITTGYASAPLAAPVDFSLPRTPGIDGHRDFNVSQHSAPIHAPQDFSNAYTSSRPQQHPQQVEREYEHQGQTNGDSGNQGPVQLSPHQQQQVSPHQHHLQQQRDESSYRKRSYEDSGPYESS